MCRESYSVSIKTHSQDEPSEQGLSREVVSCWVRPVCLLPPPEQNRILGIEDPGKSRPALRFPNPRDPPVGLVGQIPEVLPLPKRPHPRPLRAFIFSPWGPRRILLTGLPQFTVVSSEQAFPSKPCEKLVIRPPVLPERSSPDELGKPPAAQSGHTHLRALIPFGSVSLCGLCILNSLPPAFTAGSLCSPLRKLPPPLCVPRALSSSPSNLHLLPEAVSRCLLVVCVSAVRGSHRPARHIHERE